MVFIPLRPKRNRHIICPLCQGTNIELIYQRVEGRYWRNEEYFCYDCQCEWDWTLHHPFLRPPIKIRPPQWVRIE